MISVSWREWRTRRSCQFMDGSGVLPRGSLWAEEEQTARAVATSLPVASSIPAVENATRRPNFDTTPVARSNPLDSVTGRRSLTEMSIVL